MCNKVVILAGSLLLYGCASTVAPSRPIAYRPVNSAGTVTHKGVVLQNASSSVVKPVFKKTVSGVGHAGDSVSNKHSVKVPAPPPQPVRLPRQSVSDRTCADAVIHPGPAPKPASEPALPKIKAKPSKPKVIAEPSQSVKPKIQPAVTKKPPHAKQPQMTKEQAEKLYKAGFISREEYNNVMAE